MDCLEQLGTKAFQKGLWGDYKSAVAILTKAISKYPFDKRLYNDRSFYYFKLKNYKNALHDADSMLKLFPNYTRSYFRKGEVLMELKKYEEAEHIFQDLLKLDPNNKEASFYLLEAQIKQITKDGRYWVQDAKRALELNDYDTKQAKSFLEVEGENRLNNYDKRDLYYSDEEMDESPPDGLGPDYCLGAEDDRPYDDDYDPLVDPSNPFQSNALWVGNVTAKVTEQNLEPIFSKYGKIKSLFVQHKHFCAFVNYAHPNMASNAMRNFPKNFHFEDTTLVIRYPHGAKTRNILNSGPKAAPKK